MIYPIAPRPLPAAWLRVWRSLGLDVSALDVTERGTVAEAEIPAQEKNPHPQPRTQ
jgi:hypothetical protein